MTIQKIIGEHGVQSHLCNGGACPTLVLANDGEVFIQGDLPLTDESLRLAAPKGEGFVKMSRSAFERLARQVLSS